MSTAAGLGVAGPAALPQVSGAVIPLVTNNLATGGLGVNLGNSLFDRQAFVGLVTPFGAFTMGRQYTPGYLTGAAFDASQTQSSLAAGQVATFPPAFDIRLSNTIQYGIQTSGVTATLMYGAGEIAGNSSASRFWAAWSCTRAMASRWVTAATEEQRTGPEITAEQCVRCLGRHRPRHLVWPIHHHQGRQSERSVHHRRQRGQQSCADCGAGRSAQRP
jgi:hypothetical protein